MSIFPLFPGQGMPEWSGWTFTTTTNSTQVPRYLVPDEQTAEDIAFLRAALELAHKRIDELEGEAE